MYTKQDMLNWIADNPNSKSSAVISYNTIFSLIYGFNDDIKAELDKLEPYLSWVESIVETPADSLVDLLERASVSQCVMLRILITKDVNYAVNYINKWLTDKKIDDRVDLAIRAYHGYMRFRNLRTTSK